MPATIRSCVCLSFALLTIVISGYDISGSRNPALELLPRGNTKIKAIAKIAISSFPVRADDCIPEVAPGCRVVHGGQMRKAVVNVLTGDGGVKCGISWVDENDSSSRNSKRNNKLILMPFSNYSRARVQSGRCRSSRDHIIPGFVVGRAKEGQQQTAAHSRAQSKAQHKTQCKQLKASTYVPLWLGRGA